MAKLSKANKAMESGKVDGGEGWSDTEKVLAWVAKAKGKSQPETDPLEVLRADLIALVRGADEELLEMLYELATE